MALASLVPAARSLTGVSGAPRNPRTTLDERLGSSLEAGLRAAASVRPRPLQLVEQRAGVLPAPVEDAGAAAVAGRVVLAGGLTASDVSTRDVVIVQGRSRRRRGGLPVAQHDAPAVALGRFVYLFGGGDGIRQLDHVLRIDPESGAVTAAGSLPAASSDAAAAAVGPAAYVVGGYTGQRWLDTIVAFRPRQPARVVAHLPVAVRYAAVAAVGGAIVIAGGSLPDGTASRGRLPLRPAHAGVVRRIGSLPVADDPRRGGHARRAGGHRRRPRRRVGTPTAADRAIDPRARPRRLRRAASHRPQRPRGGHRRRTDRARRRRAPGAGVTAAIGWLVPRAAAASAAAPPHPRWRTSTPPTPPGS